MYNGNVAEKMLATQYGFQHFYSVASMMGKVWLIFWSMAGLMDGIINYG
jgi:hypothetical protein